MNTGHQKYEIQVKGGKTPLKRLIKKKRILVGKGQTCDIVLPFSQISSIHAVIEVLENGKFKIYDMDSFAGVEINGQRVASCEFKEGDSLSLGGINLEICPLKSQDLPPEISNISKSLPPRPPQKLSKGQDLRLEYPLAQGGNTELSEYIFEDPDALYPIFHYNVDSQAVEVTIVFKESIQSIDYIPQRKGTYYLVGSTLSEKGGGREIFEFPYLKKREKHPVITVDDRDFLIHQLSDFKMKILGEEDSQESGNSVLLKDKIVCFSKEDIKVFIRRTEAPPQIDRAPLFRKDPEFKKYLFIVLFLVISVFTLATFYEVDKEIKEEKAPERIATILYNQKVKRIVPPKVIPKKLKKPVPKVKMKKTQPEKKLKLNVQKNKPKAKEKLPKNVTKPKPRKEIKVAKKKSTSKRIKKSTRTAKRRALNKKIVQKPKGKIGSAKSKSVNKRINKSSNTKIKKTVKKRTVKKGTVSAYKSFDFKSTVDSLVRQANTSGASVSVEKADFGDESSSLVEEDSGAKLKKVEFKDQDGSLAKLAKGKLDTRKGTGDLVNKVNVYQQELPYRTVVQGGLNPDDIWKKLVANIPRFRFCYQRELDKSARSFGGLIHLNFIIGASGHVTKTALKKHSGVPDRIKSCVIRVLRSIRFPRPLGGGVVEVDQPFNFYPRRR